MMQVRRINFIGYRHLLIDAVVELEQERLRIMSKYVKGDGLAVITRIRTSKLDELYRLSNGVGLIFEA